MLSSNPSNTPRTVVSLQLKDVEFKNLRDFIYQQCGIYIAENKKYLIENRLIERIRQLGLRSYGEYYLYLKFDTNRQSELMHLFEAITTNETSFYRNPPQLEIFQKTVLSQLLEDIQKKGQKKLRIWSAGCSSGEEPYTIGIILHEALSSEIALWDIKITANDLSKSVVEKAKEGLYTEYTLRTTPPNIINRYFTKEEGSYRISQKVKDLVSFGTINLKDKKQLKLVDRSHIIFCRNVIIYFDDEMKKQIISSFYDNMLAEGTLIIGHSESLHNISKLFKPEQYSGGIIYHKRE